MLLEDLHFCSLVNVNITLTSLIVFQHMIKHIVSLGMLCGSFPHKQGVDRSRWRVFDPRSLNKHLVNLGLAELIG